MKHALFLFTLLLAGVAHADIYTSTDANGVAQFSDTSTPQAKTIQLAATQTYTAEKAEINDATAPVKQIAEVKLYQSLVIKQPHNAENIHNAAGKLHIVVALKPKLRPGDKLNYLLDNSPIKHAKKATSVQLTNLDRGAHTLQVQVVDKAGGVLIASNSLTFHMQRPRVLHLPK